MTNSDCMYWNGQCCEYVTVKHGESIFKWTMVIVNLIGERRDYNAMENDDDIFE